MHSPVIYCRLASTNVLLRSRLGSYFNEVTCCCNHQRQYSLKVPIQKQQSKSRATTTSNATLIQRSHPKKAASVVTNLKQLFTPVEVKPMITSQPDIISSATSSLSGNGTYQTQTTATTNVGQELTGTVLQRNDLLRIITDFYRRDEIKKLAADNGLDIRLFQDAYVSFRKFCVQSTVLPVDLHIVFSDILSNAGHVTDIFPYFLSHAREMFPHLTCMDDLKQISDLRDPANWYPDARAIQRKIVFHAGPTNSGKTYQALKRYMESESGVYCGPLKLLASEVYHKTNALGTKCDLITGEERRFADPEGKPADHVACTVEMANLATLYEVAVIDEIQMMRDAQRGWAWTRALLGLRAKEIHLCGEASAINFVRELMITTGDEVEVRQYQRLTNLTYLDKSIETFDNVRRGDCFVCFSKNDIFHVTRELERRGHEVAVIYGSLPPGTKLLQAQRFNDPYDVCKIMVSTDAIGMGLNLSIKRIIFYSIVRPQMNEKGEKEKDSITTSQALQIGGRAGRYGTQFIDGEVTTFHRDDLQLFKDIVSRPVEIIQRAGLHPTAEQIELFAYHLPKHTLSKLIDIFITLSQLDDSLYFMCNVEDVKFLADIIEHVPLPLKPRYIFSCAPINRKMPFVCTMFLKYARQYSRGEPATFNWLVKQLQYPFQTPNTIMDLIHLEEVFDCLDLYLWLSYRFADIFPEKELVRGVQSELDQIIHLGVQSIVKLIRRTRHLDDDSDGLIITATTLAVEDAVNDKNKIPVRPIIGLEEEVAINSTSHSTTHPSIMSSSKKLQQTIHPNRLLQSYLNALKSQAEARGHAFNDSEDLINQLINKNLLHQRAVDKLEKQLCNYKEIKTTTTVATRVNKNHNNTIGIKKTKRK